MKTTEGKLYTIHKKDLHINKDRVKKLLDEKGMEYMELYRKAEDKYGLDITYKTFMNLLSNRSTWKLIYAWAIADMLNVEIYEIYDMVEIDQNKAVEERKEWEKKYINKGERT